MENDSFDKPDQSVLEYSGSTINPEGTSEEISNKISQLMPDIGVIHATGIIKQTESFRETKQIMDNFVQGMSKIDPDELKPVEPCKVPEDPRSALEKCVDSLYSVVSNMVKANIEVPLVYKNFLDTVKPKTVEPNEVKIENKSPSFKIAGIGDNGEVKIATSTPVVLKKGNTTIKLINEKLKETLSHSQNVDCKLVQDMRDWARNNIQKFGSLDKVPETDWADFGSIIRNRVHSLDKMSLPKYNNIESKPLQPVSSYQTDVLDKLENDAKVKIEVPKSVNKNAYEIRLEIILKATEMANGDPDKATEIAEKLYRFVEGKRR